MLCETLEVKLQFRGAASDHVDSLLAADQLATDSSRDAYRVVFPLLASLESCCAESTNGTRSVGIVAGQTNNRVCRNHKLHNGNHLSISLLRFGCFLVRWLGRFGFCVSIKDNLLGVAGTKLDFLAVGKRFAVQFLVNFDNVRVNVTFLKALGHELTHGAFATGRMTVDGYGRRAVGHGHGK